MSLQGLTPEQVQKELSRSQMATLLPHLKDDIEQLILSTQNRVFKALRDGTYTAEMGDGAWREAFALHNVLNHYKTRASLVIKE